MFQNLIKLVAFIPILFLSNATHAQNLDDDLAKIVKHLDSARTVSLLTDVIVYTKKGGNTVFTTKASLKRSGNSSLTALDDMEYFSDDSYFVTIDHEEKRVAVVKNDQQKQNDLPKNFDVKSLRKLITEETDVKPKVKLVSNTNDVRTYSITGIPEVDEIKMVLNMKSLSIVSITYQYSNESEYKGQFISVNYTSFDCNTDVSGSLKQSNFFSISGGKVVLSTRLKAYTLYSEL